MPVLLTFDEQIATEVASVLTLVSDRVSEFTQTYTKKPLIMQSTNPDDPVHTIFKDDLSYLIQNVLTSIHQEPLRDIITNDIKSFISSSQDLIMITSSPYSFLGVYEQHTRIQIYNTGAYNLELTQAQKANIDSYQVLDTYPSKKTLFIKYLLVYLIPDKLKQYIESYTPIQTILHDIQNTTLTQGSIQALSIIQNKYNPSIN